MKRVFIVAAVVLLSAVSCGFRSQPAPAGDGSSVIAITSPAMVIQGKKIFIYYLRDGVPVRSLMQKNMSLEDPVLVEPDRWQKDWEVPKTVLLDPADHYDFRGVEDCSEFVPSPDGVQLFFTAFNIETGKRDLYWIRATGGFPVQISSDDWWVDFSVPFAFMEDTDRTYIDGSKVWVLLCLVSSPVCPPAVAAVWMDGRSHYLQLSHDNDLFEEQYSFLWMQKGEITTKAGHTVHYLELSSENTIPGTEVLRYRGGDFQSPMVWDEEVARETLAGHRYYNVCKRELLDSQDDWEVTIQLLPNFDD